VTAATAGIKAATQEVVEEVLDNLTGGLRGLTKAKGGEWYCEKPQDVLGGASKKAMGEAHNAANAAKYSEHLKQLEKYGSAGTKELQNGRIRYYGNVTPASKPGEMAGRRVVREWDPSTGNKRTWMETVDHNGNVRIVRPETGGTKTHYMFDKDGNFTETF
jgi:hypothetical protein